MCRALAPAPSDGGGNCHPLPCICIQVPIEPYLITDGAFGAERNVLPSYNEADDTQVAGAVGRVRRAFNGRHRPPRSVVERAFGILKGRCRSLLKLDMRLERMTPHIKACVAVHNILISCREAFDENLFVPDDAAAAPPQLPPPPLVAGPHNAAGDDVRVALGRQFLSNATVGVWAAPPRGGA